MIDLQPFIWYQLEDSSGSRATQRMYLQRAQLGSAKTAATQLRTLYQAMSGCTYLEQHIVMEATELFPSPPSYGTDVRRCALFVFATDVVDQFALISVASIRLDTVLQTGCGAGVSIDLTHPDVAAFVAGVTNGMFANKWGATLTTCAAAFMRVELAYLPGGYLPL